MHDRFTDRTRKIIQLASDEARRLNHEYVGTEHLLLGLVKAYRGVGVVVLENLNCEPEKIIREIDRLILPGPSEVTVDNLPQTPRVKNVIELAIDEARRLKHDYVGSEHILLGLLRDQECVAAALLSNLGVSLEHARAQLVSILGHGQTKEADHSPDSDLGPRR